MYLINGNFFIDDSFKYGSIKLENGLFGEFCPGEFNKDILENVTDSDDQYIDLEGAFVIPGLVDIHIHGAVGRDVSDGDSEAIRSMAGYLVKQGVTSFLPTTMSLPKERILKVTCAFQEAVSQWKGDAARILGLRLEGPFLSPEKKGAQNEEYLINPDEELFREVFAEASGNIKIIDMAPELSGATDFIKSFKDDVLISVGHTTSDYECAMRAFKSGAGHLTHLYNPMNPFLSRNPGPIGAAIMNENVTAEIITDGIHSHPSSVKAAFRLFGNRLCIISDSVRCCGMEDGIYDLSGQRVRLEGKKVVLEDSEKETIAGAAQNLYDNLLSAIEFGLPKEKMILAATRVPADIVGEKRIGRIEKGAFADFIICDENLNRKHVFISGCQISIGNKKL